MTWYGLNDCVLLMSPTTWRVKSHDMAMFWMKAEARFSSVSRGLSEEAKPSIHELEPTLSGPLWKVWETT